MLKLAGFNSTIYSFNKKTGVSFTPRADGWLVQQAIRNVQRKPVSPVSPTLPARRSFRHPVLCNQSHSSYQSIRRICGVGKFKLTCSASAAAPAVQYCSNCFDQTHQIFFNFSKLQQIVCSPSKSAYYRIFFWRCICHRLLSFWNPPSKLSQLTSSLGAAGTNPTRSAIAPVGWRKCTNR